MAVGYPVFEYIAAPEYRFITVERGIRNEGLIVPGHDPQRKSGIALQICQFGAPAHFIEARLLLVVYMEVERIGCELPARTYGKGLAVHINLYPVGFGSYGFALCVRNAKDYRRALDLAENVPKERYEPELGFFKQQTRMAMWDLTFKIASGRTKASRPPSLNRERQRSTNRS